MSRARSHGRSRTTRAVAATVAAMLFLTGLPFAWAGGAPAAADFGAGQAARFNENLNGDYLLIGNTVFRCGSSNSDCQATNTNNDALNMSNNDPDGTGALFNGSSGSFTIPSGSVVEAAYLYWGGNFGARSSSNNYYCNSSRNSVSLATADKTKANTVKLAVGAGAYSTVTADTIYTSPAGGLSQTATTSNSSGLVYEGVSDVTAAFAGVPAATATTVKVADIQAAQGNNCHAGWGLAVVYRFPANNCIDGDTDTSKRNDYRNVALYDGLLNQQEDTADTTTTLSAFITTGSSSQQSELRLGAIAWEGDQFITGDRMRVKATNASGEGTAVDPAGPATSSNFFDSGKQPIADHNSDLDTNPDSGAVIQQGYVNGRGDGHGTDAKTQAITVPGGTTSIDVRFQTDGDNYYPGGMLLSSPIKCLLSMQKDQAVNGVAAARDNSTNPSPAVKAGDELTYTVTAVASGDVALSTVAISDLVPAGTTYVANSGKWGSGSTAAVAAAGTSNATLTSGTVSAAVGTLDPLSGGSCASGKKCYAQLSFKVTVNSGLAAGTVVTNQAYSTFNASGVTGIRENSNAVTDRVGPRLTVSKAIVDPVTGDPSTFNFAVSCNGSPTSGSPFALANGASRSLTVPPGAVCSVTETTSPNFAVGVTGDITTNGGSVTMNADKTVAFTNTRQFGRITVAKAVVPVTGDPVAAPTFSFTVACPGTTGYPRTLQVGGTGGSVSTPSDIPYGNSCTVTETAATGWTTGAAVSVNPVDEATETASFSNSRRTGSLQINKATIGGDGAFSFAVDCPGTAFDSTRSVTTAAGAGSTTVTGLPSGMSCTVTETVPAGWTLTSTNSPSVTTQAGATSTVAFTNTRQTADLLITKEISGQYATPVTGTFPFRVDCGTAGVFTPSITATDAADGTATVPGIPVGSTCTITETLPTGWTLDTTITGNTNPRTLTTAAAGNTVTFTNRRDVGVLTVRKTLDSGTGTFVFDVVCNDVAVPGSPLSISVAAPATNGTATVADVPTGSRCVVTERTDTTGSFEQVTPANGAPVTVASTRAADTAEFVNRRLTGDLVIEKVFPADSLGDPAAEFEFTWDCGPEPRSVMLRAGASHTVSGVPTGTVCTVDETATPGYTITSLPLDGTVTIGRGANKVTVTNTRDTGTLELRKDLVPASDTGRFDLLIGGQARATAVGDDGSTGAVRLTAGNHLVAEADAADSPSRLSDYDSSLACANRAGPVQVGTDGTVFVAAGEAVVCTYTNSRKATIEVVKSLSPADDPGIFSLLIDQPAVAKGGDGTTSGPVVVPVGAHTIGEIAGDPDTDLADYDASIACTTNDGPPVDGAVVDAAYGDRIRCVVSNVRKQGDLSIAKTPVSLFTVPGGTATFSITVANAAGAGVARDVRVEDPLPTGTTYVSSSDDLCDPDGTSCALGTLAAGASRTFTITHQVAADADIAVVHNAATVTSPDDPTSPGAEADVPVARLGVVKSAAQPWFSAVGQSIDYSYVVSNPGGIALTGVTVTDNKIPTSQIDCNGSATGNGQPFTLTAGATLDCRASATVTAGDVAAERVDNVATADSDQTEPTGDTWTVPLAALDIDKTLTATGPFSAGDELTYDIVVTNSGAVALTSVSVTDPAADGFDQATDCEPVAPVGSLEPGATIRCSAAHTVTQADVDAGTFTNTATASSTEIPLVADQVTTTFSRTPTLDLVKTVTSSGPYELGDTVGYSLVATNTGNTTLHGVHLTESNGATLGDCDPSGAGPDDAGVTLRPGESVTCQATWVVTQRAVDAGSHRNTAAADSDETAPVTDDATVPVAQAPAMALTKRVAEDPEPPARYATGDEVHYVITLANTGTVTLTGARITDAGVGAVLGDCEPSQPATLAPGAELSCEATHTVGQADVDAAQYTNVASGRSDQVAPVTDSETVPVGQNPAIAVTKSVTSVGPYGVDDPIVFELSLENTGDMTLTGVTLEELTSDAALGECAPALPATLAPGAELTCSALHVVTQDDLDAGVYVNVARGDSDQTEPEQDEVEVPLAQSPGLELTKTVTNDGPYVFGSEVTYSLVATNTGNVTLNNVRITESEGATIGVCDPGAAGVSIAPGDSLTCAASYTIDQGDVDDGSHTNTATADSDETTSVDDDAQVPVYQDPALEIVKSIATEPAPPAGGYERGDTIHYTVVATNTGTVTLTDVAVTDPNADDFDATEDCDREVPVAALAPGARITCTAEHEVTQGDIDAGRFTNVAYATSDQTPEVDDDEVVLFTSAPLLRLAKTVTSTGPYELGDTVTYSLVASNAGNVTLNGVSITESEGASLGTCQPAAPTSLEPGGQLVCEASYVIGQGDVDAGSHLNTATADSEQTEPVDADATVPTFQAPALEVSKSVTSSGPYAVGDTMTFSVVAANTGNTTLTGVTLTEQVDDALLGECLPAVPATLAVGESLGCTATHVVTQRDIDAGSYRNEVLGDSAQTPPDTGDVEVPIDQFPGLELVKTVTNDGPYALGDTVRYSLVATNTGNTTLHNVRIDESQGAVLGDCSPDISEGQSVALAPGAALSCVASYEIRQGDVDAGSHTNSAEASSDETPVVDDDATVPVTQAPALSVEKRVTSDGPYSVGDDIDFDVVVTNTGTVTLTGVVVEEITPDTELISCSPATPGTLAPGAAMTCAAVHEVAQGDIDASAFTNLAQGDSDQTEPDTGDVRVPLQQRPALQLTKTVTSDGPYELGDTVSYSLVARNNGNVTLTGVSITESNGAVLGTCAPEAPATLAPRGTLRCDASYVITQDDVDAGTHLNTAVADSEQTEPVDADALVPVYRAPALGITKVVTNEGPFERGDTIEYSVVVTNTGNTTLTDVVVGDDDADGFDAAADCLPASPVASLAVGGSITCAARHVVSQADVNAGTFSNTATADSAETEQVDDTEVTPFGQEPLLSLTKSETSSGPYELGDTVTYSLVATNTGNVTLDGVSITESEGASLGECTPPQELNPVEPGAEEPGDPDAPLVVSLEPGESLTCVASYVVRQGDVNAGTHRNTATADSEQTEPVEDDADVPVYRNPELELRKRVTSSGTYDLGDTVTYSLVATNTGNTTLTGVSITESDGASLGECEPAAPATLEPGDQLSCEASYQIAQADVNAGTHLNTATADSEQTEPVDADATVPVYRNPLLDIEKSVSNEGPFEVGDTVEYSLVATNTGNTTLTGVTVAELTEDAPLGECDVELPATLEPGEKVTCSATHVATQADVDAGEYLNEAAADSEETEQVTDDATVPFEQSPELGIEKSVTSEGPYELDSVVSYSIVATNNGNVTLRDVRITESVGAVLGSCQPGTELLNPEELNPVEPGLEGEEPAPEVPAGVTLAPGATLTCTATYTIGQSDVDAAEHLNTATADSDLTDPVDDSAEVPVEAEVGLNVVKTVTSEGPYSLGSPITFSVVATNSGTTTLTGVTVAEVNEDAQLSGCDPTVPTTLAPGATITCTATHLVTQRDFDAGSYRNVALADSEQTDPTEDEEVVQTPDPAVDLAITKRLIGDLVTGRQGTYELVVTNNGPATATSIVVTDSVPAGLKPVSASGEGWACAIDRNDVRCTSAGPLRSGEKLATVTVVVDVLASGSESVSNTGVVGGDQPDRDPSNNRSTVTSPISEVGGNSIDPEPTPAPTPAPETQVGGLQKLIDRLPFTGGSLIFGGFGAALLVAGMVLFFVSRRRREED